MIPGVVANMRNAISRCLGCSDVLRVDKTPKTSGHCIPVVVSRCIPMQYSVQMKDEKRTSFRVLPRDLGHRVANLVSHTVVGLGTQRLEKLLSDGVGGFLL
jgi:hypothetical protein